MIRITRRSEFIDLLEAYRIVIDGIDCGKIKRGETKEFEVESGYHTLSVRIGLLGIEGSNTLHIYVSDSIVDIEIQNTLMGWKRWVPFLDGNLANDEHLFLSVLRETALTSECEIKKDSDAVE